MSIFVFTFRYTIPILCKKCIKIPTSISIERHYLSAIILISHSLFKNIEVEIQREDLKYFQDNYRVSNLCHNDNSIIVRIVTDNPPTDCQYTTAKPTLENILNLPFEFRPQRLYFQAPL